MLHFWQGVNPSIWHSRFATVRNRQTPPYLGNQYKICG